MVVITIFHNFQAKTIYYCLLGHQICRTLVQWLMSQEIQLPYAAADRPIHLRKANASQTYSWKLKNTALGQKAIFHKSNNVSSINPSSTHLNLQWTYVGQFVGQPTSKPSGRNWERTPSTRGNRWLGLGDNGPEEFQVTAHFSLNIVIISTLRADDLTTCITTISTL